MPHGGFVGREEARGLGLKFEVKIANGPADACGGGGRDIERDCDHRLGVLLNRVAGGGGLEKRVAVFEWCVEFEAEFGAVCGDAAPEAFRERHAFDAQGDFGEGNVGSSDGSLDEMKHE